MADGTEGDPAASGRVVTELTDLERHLLEWLAREDESRYGECHGKTFDALEKKGFVKLNGPRGHVNELKFGCGLTEAGKALVAELQQDRTSPGPG